MKVLGPFTRVSFEPINLNSPDQIKEFLLSIGWKPKHWNFKKDGKRIVRDEKGNPIKTSPKLPEEDEYEYLEKQLNHPIGSLISRRYILKHRKSILYNDDDPTKGWINQVRSDGRLGAVCIPQATNTGRGRHAVVVNVPKAKESIPYGIELRSLLGVADGHCMVGTDAKALEARIQAHYVYPYTGGKELANILCTGDIHAHNAKVFGTDRDGAKSPYYALELRRI